MVPSSSRVSRVQERGTCGAGRSQGVLGGPDYFCLGAVPRNEQGGVKERKECFSQGQIKAKPQMREKTNNIKRAITSLEKESSTTKEQQHNQ